MRRGGWSVLAACAAVVAAAVPLGAAPAGAAPAVIGCGQAAERVQITADADLDPTCTYTGGFDITASNVTLDCRGAHIVGGDADGIGIHLHAPTDAAMHDVTVTGCDVSGFTNNLRVTRDGFGALAAGHEYEGGTSAITVAHNRFHDSKGVGVYVNAYVSGVTIADDAFHDAGSTAIYLETGSRQNTIERNEVVHNGYGENGTAGQTFEFGGSTVWYWGTGREGLAVDGSYDNVIRRNHFERNSNGGIFLYENCGENQDDPSWIERRYPAERNRIEGNSFASERTGVWVASRQGENVFPMDCSDPAYVTGPVLRISLDHAPSNTILANSFTGVTYGVRVEDDDTTVEGNSFSASSPDHHAVIVGTPYRTTDLHQPITGTVLRSNTSAIAGNDSPYRWVHGTTATTVEGNQALGQPVGICQGEPPPRSLFVMVIAVAAAEPDGSEPPTPDLTFPTLGALASCQGPAATSTTTSTTAPPTSTAAAPAAPVTGSADYAG
ncbi:right-handed parallel beta-helix repeat-containing protein [Aquihabitans sp. McL0605]|uniref:right-handed parallel beta-helix repeat-containing protein n=1 Tax=Aquihabitans sp. McL0605 TaxID=3415671 RepID=UPI003CE756C1